MKMILLKYLRKSTHKRKITNNRKIIIKLPDMLWDLFDQFTSTIILTCRLKGDTNETKYLSFSFDLIINLPKLGDGLDESPTVMVGETKQQKTW